jgi:4-carboxymuconolactone decarboxylase
MKKQTAGRERLGKLAPKFAELNDDVLFGEVWSREEQLSPRDRSMITIAALFSAGLYPQLRAHLAIGREHGVTKEEAVELVTHLAFYCGWPKAWSTFPMIEEVWPEEEDTEKKLSVRRAEHSLRDVFHRAELSRPADYGADTHLLRDL